MKCFKCDSKYLSINSKRIRELAKGSPSKGKNKKFVEIKVTEVSCRSCLSTEFKYEEIGDRK